MEAEINRLDDGTEKLDSIFFDPDTLDLKEGEDMGELILEHTWDADVAKSITDNVGLKFQAIAESFADNESSSKSMRTLALN